MRCARRLLAIRGLYASVQDSLEMGAGTHPLPFLMELARHFVDICACVASHRTERTLCLGCLADVVGENVPIDFAPACNWTQAKCGAQLLELLAARQARLENLGCCSKWTREALRVAALGAVRAAVSGMGPSASSPGLFVRGRETQPREEKGASSGCCVDVWVLAPPVLRKDEGTYKSLETALSLFSGRSVGAAAAGGGDAGRGPETADIERDTSASAQEIARDLLSACKTILSSGRSAAELQHSGVHLVRLHTVLVGPPAGPSYSSSSAASSSFNLVVRESQKGGGKGSMQTATEDGEIPLGSGSAYGRGGSVKLQVSVVCVESHLSVCALEGRLLSVLNEEETGETETLSRGFNSEKGAGSGKGGRPIARVSVSAEESEQFASVLGGAESVELLVPLLDSMRSSLVPPADCGVETEEENKSSLKNLREEEGIKLFAVPLFEEALETCVSESVPCVESLQLEGWEEFLERCAAEGEGGRAAENSSSVSAPRVPFSRAETMKAAERKRKALLGIPLSPQLSSLRPSGDPSSSSFPPLPSGKRKSLTAVLQQSRPRAVLGLSWHPRDFPSFVCFSEDVWSDTDGFVPKGIRGGVEIPSFFVEGAKHQQTGGKGQQNGGEKDRKGWGQKGFSCPISRFGEPVDDAEGLEEGAMKAKGKAQGLSATHERRMNEREEETEKEKETEKERGWSLPTNIERLRGVRSGGETCLAGLRGADREGWSGNLRIAVLDRRAGPVKQALQNRGQLFHDAVSIADSNDRHALVNNLRTDELSSALLRLSVDTWRMLAAERSASSSVEISSLGRGRVSLQTPGLGLEGERTRAVLETVRAQTETGGRSWGSLAMAVSLGEGRKGPAILRALTRPKAPGSPKRAPADLGERERRPQEGTLLDSLAVSFEPLDGDCGLESFYLVPRRLASLLPNTIQTAPVTELEDALEARDGAEDRLLGLSRGSVQPGGQRGAGRPGRMMSKLISLMLTQGTAMKGGGGGGLLANGGMTFGSSGMGFGGGTAENGNGDVFSECSDPGSSRCSLELEDDDEEMGGGPAKPGAAGAGARGGAQGQFAEVPSWAGENARRAQLEKLGLRGRAPAFLPPRFAGVRTDGRGARPARDGLCDLLLGICGDGSSDGVFGLSEGSLSKERFEAILSILLACRDCATSEMWRILMVWVSRFQNLSLRHERIARAVESLLPSDSTNLYSALERMKKSKFMEDIPKKGFQWVVPPEEHPNPPHLQHHQNMPPPDWLPPMSQSHAVPVHLPGRKGGASRHRDGVQPGGVEHVQKQGQGQARGSWQTTSFSSFSSHVSAPRPPQPHAGAPAVGGRGPFHFRPPFSSGPVAGARLPPLGGGIERGRFAQQATFSEMGVMTNKQTYPPPLPHEHTGTKRPPWQGGPPSRPPAHENAPMQQAEADRDRDRNAKRPYTVGELHGGAPARIRSSPERERGGGGQASMSTSFRSMPRERDSTTHRLPTRTHTRDQGPRQDPLVDIQVDRRGRENGKGPLSRRLLRSLPGPLLAVPLDPGHRGPVKGQIRLSKSRVPSVEDPPHKEWAAAATEGMPGPGRALLPGPSKATFRTGEEEAEAKAAGGDPDTETVTSALPGGVPHHRGTGSINGLRQRGAGVGRGLGGGVGVEQAAGIRREGNDGDFRTCYSKFPAGVTVVA